jgi:tetratricopeptide (TPR) repeat protein
MRSGNVKFALKHFSLAYEQSLPIKDDSTIRACAFNLGAAYVALRKPKQGLSLLQRAIPPPKSSEAKCNGDLFFNFGLAYELLSVPIEAVKYYELSLEEYQTITKDHNMEAAVALKLGSLYSTLRSHLQAARVYSIAAMSHGKMRHLAEQIGCMCHQANALWRARKRDDALDIADDCMVLCQGVHTENGSLGKPTSHKMII